MIDIIFSDSACGSLKMAQNYGRGKYCGMPASVGIFITRHDGSKPTAEELDAAKREFEENERLVWERAIPLGGNPADVYGFALTLSMGDISEKLPGEKRRQVLELLYSIYPDFEEGPAFTAGMMQTAADALKEICGRFSAGEDLRIWYGSNPDDMCGLHWLMAQLTEIEQPCGQVYLVRLPEWEVDENGNATQKSGWGEVSPGEWYRYLALQQTASTFVCQGYAAAWEALKEENAPLRAVINGRLVSVPETLYDSFILSEIALEAEEFQEAMVIGKVLGRYRLGIGDAWIALRIGEMIRAGLLEPVTVAEAHNPVYHRILRKRVPDKAVERMSVK